MLPVGISDRRPEATRAVVGGPPRPATRPGFLPFSPWPRITTPCCTSTTPTGSGWWGAGPVRDQLVRPPRQRVVPSPVASLASALLGLQLNEAVGDELRTVLWARTRRILEHLDKLGAFTLNRSGFPIVEVPLADPDDLARAGRFLPTGAVPARPGHLPDPRLLPGRAPRRGRTSR